MTKLYVGNLPYSTRKEDLADAFRQTAVINSVQIVTDSLTGRSRGFGFVEVATKADAQAVVSMWDGEDFGERPLKVNIARPREERPQTEYEGPPLAEFLCERPIIEVSNYVSIALMKYLQAHPVECKKMDRRRFEELVAELWSGFGYTVELTKRTRDGGVDVIAVRKAMVEERFLIECKRPDPGNCVGIVPVRALYGVLASERATKAILATTARFSKDAIIFFDDHKWQLEGRDFHGLMEWINEYISQKS